MRTASAVLIIAMAMVAQSASAQTIIDMPPPPAPKASASLPDAEVIVGDTVMSAAAAPYYQELKEPQPTVGEVAISRYARARTGTYSTYFNDGPWNYRRNSSWWWGGNWGWGWGWPIWNVGCCRPSGGHCAPKA